MNELQWQPISKGAFNIMNALQIPPTSKVAFSEVANRLYLIIAKKLISNCPYNKDMTDEQLDKYSNITLTVKEYMDILGIKNRGSAYEQLNTAVYALLHASFFGDKTIKTKVKGGVKTKVAHYKSPVFSRVEINKKGDNRSYVINGKVNCKLTLNIMRQIMQDEPIKIVIEIPQVPTL